MFTSRTARFAEEIRRETNGRGVDLILNSLTGDLFNKSWQPTADGGIMAEIGKRDIVDCNSLTMVSFDCNCSFRAVNLSDTREITNTLVGDLLGEVFDLINGVVLDRSIPSPATPLTRPCPPCRICAAASTWARG
ncbi:Acyl transferase/acyl hydrolase/lysophospholipase [Penicillium samsonianum]|uniref:Acyl transferase/acyl hydrolase/lysophospholipase n=1 Tax=Penicillium samsonianum TaxID=1882272 RepID=UPI0025484B1D|nr:Acyl transferase/acyl hydrolase/lysophospholipase [Penicillium samsonianum]KAJ6150021.1 Acyl transferase/acyl hydrolase/lysophospholipase [Penicillium samsonianum]